MIFMRVAFSCLSAIVSHALFRLGIVGLWSYESGLRIGPKSNLPRGDKCDFNRRIVIGLGVGQATLDTKVQGYQMANGNAT